MPKIIILKSNLTQFNRTEENVDSMTIGDLFKKYLRSTNSIVSLRPEDYLFQFNNKILNKYPDILEKKVGEYNWRTDNPTIKVIECEALLGGKMN